MASSSPANTLVIRTSPFGGFWSNFNCVINHLAHSLGRDGTQAIRVEWSPDGSVENFPYGGGTCANVWETFFEPLPFVHFPELTRETWEYADSRMTHEAAYLHMYKLGRCRRALYHAVFRRYIKLKPHIEAHVGAFYTRQLSGHTCLGIHYRNPRHSAECPEPIPPVEDFIAWAEELVGRSADARVYLATDVEEAVARFERVFGERLVYQAAATRARALGDEQVHHRCDTPSVKLGTEVLVDCLMLARCHTLLHSTSNVATAAGYMNPALELRYAERSAIRGISIYAYRHGRRALGRWHRRLVRS